MRTLFQKHPSGQTDPLILMAILLFLAGGLGGAYLVLAEDGGAESEANETAYDDKVNPEKKTKKKTQTVADSKKETPSKKKVHAAAGWIPTSAKEATNRGSLPTSANPRRHCQEKTSLVTEGLSMITGFEGYLREASAIPLSEEITIADALERYWAFPS